ncbi:sigma-54 interaction domain-containing protein [Mesobacillus zeae]|uniref:PAS domain S-box protein n=1 Tax=Mesobacillus zeae TaxID=1917180 RepID=A0A398B2L7_9BACI|nr:sigma 54-interacting transcriptional regulator [Mesobacillus zeae]RID84117.1 PAS domain S-box protein [Mesobacillus zeae]
MNLTEKMTGEVLGAILGSIDEAIHVVDTEGITIFYNEVAASHDGLKREEVLGKPLLKLFPSLSEKSSTLLTVLKTNKPLYNKTQIFVNLHGKKIETVNTTLPIFMGGQLIGAVEIAKDYSRLKQLSEQLLDLKKDFHKPAKKEEGQQGKYTFQDLLTLNDSFADIKNRAEKLAKSASPFLIYGESGTGKELFVHAIHNASQRSGGPLVAQNCAAIPESLLESILFGTSKGSYTGAVDRPGLFELANGGTLFLDELHAMPVELQAKLLRVLEDSAVRRIGSSSVKVVDVRVVAAMNIHPRQAMEEKKIREDVFYRLNVLSFELAPLRKRKEDIMFLANVFIGKFNEKLSKRVEGPDSMVEVVFNAHSWPGNVRELKHTIEYMMNVCEGPTLTSDHLPPFLQNAPIEKPKSMESLSLRENLRVLEKELIEKALVHSGGNIQKAASLLDIPRQTLQYKLKK